MVASARGEGVREVRASGFGVPLRGDESVLEWWWLHNLVDTLKPLNGAL